MIERRIVLSSYSLNEVGYFGANSTGADPQSTLVADANGNFYGTALKGGAYGLGSVYEIAYGSTAITTLASFNGTDGWNLQAGVTLDSSGDLFGTTGRGGTYDDGTVFEIAAASDAITTLASFNGTNGSNPLAAVTLDAFGNLFGTTNTGGAGGYGTVFEIATGSDAISTLASFNGVNGAHPYAGLTLDLSGNLYGTTYQGGAYNCGAVFEVAKGSSQITTIESLLGGADFPYAGLTMDSSGNLYGTANEEGETTYLGGVFEIPNGSKKVTTLAEFATPNGASPKSGVLLDAAGNLYWTTSGDSINSYGTVFELTKGSTAITTLASFNNTNGAMPAAGVILDTAGNLYGATSAGGANGTGVVFEIPNGSGRITASTSFGPLGGSSSYGNITLDAGGNLYGTTYDGGANNLGTVFEIARASSAVTTLASFNGGNGKGPMAGVTFDSSGNLYGTTSGGGPKNDGTVFEIAKGSTAVTTIAAFDGTNNGSVPQAAVTLDPAGNIYGTTEIGPGPGSAFEVAKGSNTITTITEFSGTNGGPYPNGGLALDSAGNLYGTSLGNGGSIQGTVFEIAHGSTSATVIASFNGTDGAAPLGGVTLDAAGNLYGTTEQGGTSNDGTVFEIARDSTTITTLAAFNDVDGSWPYAGVTLDTAGNLYGTTVYGGPNGNGTVFEIANGSHAITTIAYFAAGIASGPHGGVTLNAAGDLLVATFNGGGVFELLPSPAITLALADGANPCMPSQALTYTATVSGGVPNGETVTLVDASNNNAVVGTGTLSGGSATLTVPAGTLSAGTHNLIAAYGGDANFAASESAAYAQVVQAPPPALVGTPVINGDNPNSLFTAPGQPTPGVQRSMVEDVVYTFNEPVTIPDANAAFTVQVAGDMGVVPSALLASAVPGTNGTHWAVSLTGQPVGALASIANGEYSITINPGAVFAAADGATSMTPGTGRTDTFYRLFGDAQGTESVNTLDYARFKQALAAYNPIFDVDGNGSISTLDYARFKQDLSVSFAGDGFVTSI